MGWQVAFGGGGEGEAHDMGAEERQLLDQLGSLGERMGHLQQDLKAGRLDRP